MVHLSTLSCVVSVFALSVGLLLITKTTAAVNDRCLSDYTWTATSSGNQYGYEALNPEAEMCGSSSTCGNKYPKPDSLEDRPPPVEDSSVELSFFGIVVDATKNSTCLGITYTLDRYGASKVKGVQFLLHGLGYNSHNMDCCQVLNYTVDLSYEAVVENPNSGTPVNRQFTFDCFCDLWPLEPYQLTIRTLPVDFANQTLLDPSSIFRDVKVPGCTSDRDWDQYCQKSKEELWHPQLWDPEQLFPEYLQLKITFNIAPPDYRFYEYVITIYESDNPKPKHTIVVYPSSPTFSTVSRMINGLMMNVSSVIFTLLESDVGKTFSGSMFPKCETGEPECNTATHQMENDVVEIIANPCDSDPCGELGGCEPDKHLYTCRCNGDAILDQHPILDGDICIVNPCNINPCGNLGTCGLEGTVYYCNCTLGAINDGETCISDPCNPNPCDKYSTCGLTDDFQYDCFCSDGITCIVDKCNVEDVVPSLCITMASCSESSLDLTEGWKYHDCHCRHEVVNSTNVTNICADGTCDASSCDELIHCDYFDIAGGIRYNCSCAPGFKFNDDGMCEKNKGYLWVIVLVAVLLLFAALIVGFRFIVKTRPVKSCRKNIPYNDDISTSPPTPPVPNLNNHPRDGSPDCYKPVPNIHVPVIDDCTPFPFNNEPSKRILIISTEETEEHREVVYKFANFLRNQAGLTPIIPSQNKHELHMRTLETWLSNENRHAFKVLFICSLGMWDRWVRERDRDLDPDNGIPVESEFGDAFIQMKHITSTERHNAGTLNKFAVAFFSDYLSKEKVEDIELFRGMPRYNLMADVEKLCFLLQGIEQHTPKSSRKMPFIKEYEMTPEGQALLEAIRVMKSKSKPQCRRTSAESDGTPTSERSVSGHFELNSREGSEDSIELREIPEYEHQTMASASGWFSNCSDSEEDEGSSGIRHRVDVHRQSSEDSDITPPITPDCGHFVAVPQKPEEYSSRDLDSGLSSPPASCTSMAGHLTSFDASGLAKPMPREASHLDAGVVYVPGKLDENELDSGLNSLPTSAISGAQGSSLA